MKRYVLGLAFTEANSVLMVQKNRPAWQAGKLNFIGGKIDPDPDGYGDEIPVAAMVREFYEETGIYTKQSDWKLIGSMGRAGFDNDGNEDGEDFEVVLFKAGPDKMFNYFFQMEDEEIILVPRSKFTVDRSLDQWYISNIRTIYEFAISKDCEDGAIIQIGYP